MIGVINGQRYRRITHCAAGLGAAKNNVLHLARTAQLFGAGFAQNPPDGIRNVAFAGAVRPHNTGNAFANGDPRFIREGLEALYLKFF